MARKRHTPSAELAGMYSTSVYTDRRGQRWSVYSLTGFTREEVQLILRSIRKVPCYIVIN